jgi:hypothetical protein
MIVRKLEALFTLNTNAIQFKRASSELDKLASKAETVMKAIAGYWAVQALQNFVVNTANAMAEIGKSAEYLGVGADALQEMRYAAEKSGLSVETLNDALKELQVRAVNAKSGEGEAVEAFQMLGLKSTDAKGNIRETIGLLEDVADSLKKLPTQSDRLWISDAIFGDAGAKILLMLKDGSLGLKKLRQEARDLGRVLKNDSIDGAERLNKALHRLKGSSSHVAQNMIAPTFGPLATLLDGFSKLLEKFNTFKISLASSQVVKTGFLGTLALAATKLSKVLIPLWPKVQQLLVVGGRVALRGSGIGLALLLLQDLLSFFNGAQSVTGQLASAFDKVGQSFIGFAQTAWLAAKNGFGDALHSMKKEFLIFSAWLKESVAHLVKRAHDFMAGLVPDFLKKGFLATIKQVSNPIDQAESPSLNARLAPQLSNITHQNRLSSQQNVNVAVNVSSGANPQAIGSEVSKAVQQALERERFNAFMGVTQYAS